ncbi:bifunctional indole-3-glycerol-phosphate synthase TrpC/phosphoribosylanthranilate isomerase TrpF [Acerihabitans arboris]|uniref:Multifunctional fusion protein n=1 Tax=Acerihabitans arboris TaxID=2691583 RepID=A0A845SME5_9GAMM|nr:bifunctional indole-3-glycerol-phosphate synthase TrpC/phosphoribosylanthranilate isomerase TrpF [Acerihabitans arboris]NDL62425.1 bifunctional indole-3-glycerol-phosphate synthase TrpC/phosphoribosylanthranilate isomerase TrpF [Acerihabitans arboris]
MQDTVLTKIVADKKLWIADRRQRQPLAGFRDEVRPSTRGFYHALRGSRTVFILECKKASPSKGLIREDFDPAAIAGVYKHYAAAISCLTDEKYFQGSFDFLRQISRVVTQPVLCKDFIIDSYQVYLARYYQADAILLMLSVLDDDTYRQLSDLAHSLGMGVLTEAITEEECCRARALGARVVGINNRDLRDLSIDLNRTRRLAPLLPGVTVISESGITAYRHVRELSHFSNGFLIGSALMSEPDLDGAVRRILLGENKVCGLTRPEDARAALEAGALYGGLIFAPSSPRCIDITRARAVMAGAALRYVGVFRDAPVTDVTSAAAALSLYAVQLHGNEDQAYISTLRGLLPADCYIWKALDMRTHAPARDFTDVDRYLLDNGGGSGQPFDWSLLDGLALDNVMLAGGLAADNCVAAAQLGCVGLDFNSGVESAPGIKDHHKLATVFQTLRAY